MSLSIGLRASHILRDQSGEPWFGPELRWEVPQPTTSQTDWGLSPVGPAVTGIDHGTSVFSLVSLHQ